MQEPRILFVQDRGRNGVRLRSPPSRSRACASTTRFDRRLFLNITCSVHPHSFGKYKHTTPLALGLWSALFFPKCSRRVSSFVTLASASSGNISSGYCGLPSCAIPWDTLYVYNVDENIVSQHQAIAHSWRTNWIHIYIYIYIYTYIHMQRERERYTLYI